MMAPTIGPMGVPLPLVFGGDAVTSVERLNHDIKYS